jgi:hypothetical protein
MHGHRPSELRLLVTQQRPAGLNACQQLLAVQLDSGFELRPVGRRQLIFSVTALQSLDDNIECHSG